MAKKKQDNGFMGLFKEGVSMFADIGLNAFVGNLKDVANSAREAVERATMRVLKTVTVFLIMVLGFIMIVTGYAEYLSTTVPALANGLGAVVVGGGLIIIGLIIQFFKS